MLNNKRKCVIHEIMVLKTLKRKKFSLSFHLNSLTCFFRPVDAGGFSMAPSESDLEFLPTADLKFAGSSGRS